jgi:hypothetical protein
LLVYCEKTAREGGVNLKTWPNEIELLSLLETEPDLLDISTKDLPFNYNEATYCFSNQEEDFVIRMSPAYGEMKIHVRDRSSNRLLTKLNLKQMETFEITADDKNASGILLTMENGDCLQTYEINLKPYFKLIVQMHDLA